MKKIALPHGKLTIVDDEDFEWLSQWKWNMHERGYPRRIEYRNGKPFKYIRMSRLILNAQPKQEVDHINRNPLDNRRSNLRIVTTSQNQINRPAQKNNTSGFKGVVWRESKGKWQARIGHNGKKYHLGTFTNKRKAAEVYNQAAKDFFGEVSFLNKI